jgi:transcription elongation GreA/GreB family factor
MNKRALIKKIIARLGEELEVYFRAAHASREEATHEQNKAESKYDTRGLEASYLARGQSKQAAELKDAISAFEDLELRAFAADDPIDMGAFVELEQDRERMFYFIGPKAGGTEVEHSKKEILVITPQSPLGEQLMGQKSGGRIQLSIGGGRNDYQIIKVA